MFVGITNVEFYEGKAEVIMKDLVRTLPADKEIIAVLDPPRAGVSKLISLILSAQVSLPT